MTGRTNANTASLKTKSPVQTTETRKPGRPKSNQLNNTGKLPKDTEKKLLHQSIGLKEAIDSARRSFEKGFKGNTSNRKRNLSGPKYMSSRIATRSRSGNISPIGQQNDRNESLSPSEKSPKKSSSAPASPVKPCKQDINQPKHSLTKRMKFDLSTTSTRISRSQLLLKSAENGSGNSGVLKARLSVSPISVDSEIIVNLPTSPNLRERKTSSKNSNSPNNSYETSMFTKDQSESTNTEKRLSLCSVLDSTLDASFDNSNKECLNANGQISPKIKTSPNQVPKSPNRMLLSDSKRGANANLMKNKPVSMNEVIKLHQDEGVLHLLHGLPSSRRIRSVGAVSATVVRRRPSNENSQETLMRQSQGKKSTLNSATGNDSSSNSIPGLVRKSIAMGYGPKQQRPPARQHTPKINSLFCPLTNVKPCHTEELFVPENLELLKQLPSKTYMKLWSSPSRYIIKTNDICDFTAKRSETNQMNINHLGNDISNFSNGNDGTVPLPNKSSSNDLQFALHNDEEIKNSQKQPRKPELVTKHFKDILIRSYPSFVQIILSPVTTGLKNTMNVNVIEELMDAMKQLLNIKDCKAILLTGIGTTFCQGIDLSVLAFDASEKQRKSAEAIATCVKKLVKYLLNYPKILVAAVNGIAQGLGVTLLPYFDIIFASDKATFSLSTYAKLGQVPEGFASHTFPSSNHRVFNEMLLLGKTITASEAKEIGLVSSVIWPDKFLESIIPQMELLERIPAEGLKIVHGYIKVQLNSNIVEEETKELIKNWTTTNFPKKVRQFIKLNNISFQ